MNKSYKINKADLIGILSSSICLVHCVATPLLVLFSVNIFTNPAFDLLFLFVALGSIFKATQNTSNIKIALLLWFSFVGFMIATLFHDFFEWLHYLGYLFALLLIIGHLLNIKNCNKCSSNNDNKK